MKIDDDVIEAGYLEDLRDQELIERECYYVDLFGNRCGRKFKTTRKGFRRCLEHRKITTNPNLEGV